MTDNPKTTLFLCGASLIHPKVALTAAHCVEAYSVNPNGISVRAGEHDIQKEHKTYLVQVRLKKCLCGKDLLVFTYALN